MIYLQSFFLMCLTFEHFVWYMYASVSKYVFITMCCKWYYFVQKLFIDLLKLKNILLLVITLNSKSTDNCKSWE